MTIWAIIAFIGAGLGALIVLAGLLWSIFYGGMVVVFFVQALKDRFTDKEDKHYRDHVGSIGGRTKALRENHAVIVTTQESVAGREIVETLGLVRGNTIRARNAIRDISAGLRTIIGGEIKEYTKMMAESREQAMDRMIAHARSMNADAIVCVRFTTSGVMQNAAELFVFGTAVKLR